MNSESTPCPQCGAQLPADAPQGLCPRCLAALNFVTETMLPDAAPVAPRSALTPEELAPHFPQLEIIKCLGRGGMGVVYKARQKTLNRLVALKLLAPERADDAKFAARFEKEAQALAALNHPHIVTIHDFGQAGGYFFLLMEFVDGVNLRQAMHAGRFTPEQALAIVPPVCEALQYAHEHGIVHRDIKPENLLLDKAGRVKIADFGIAKMIGTAGDKGGELLTQPLGTPAYAAPEQRGDACQVDHRADIYSLGVVLYELLTGELPKDKLEAPSKRVQIDVRLDEIVLRALETKPELRFATAAEFRTQLAEATAKAEVKPMASSQRTRKWAGVLAIVLGGALLIGAPVWNEIVDDFGLTSNARKHLQARHLVVEQFKTLKTEAANQYNQLEAARKKPDAAEIARLTDLWQALQTKTQQAEAAMNQAALFKQADEQERMAIFYLIAGGLIAAGIVALSPLVRTKGSRGMRIGLITCAGVLALLFMLRQGNTRAVTPPVSTPVTIKSEQNQSSSAFNVQWTVSAHEPGTVHIHHANGRQSSRMQWNESTHDYEMQVRIEIIRVKDELLRIHTKIGDSENIKEFTGDFTQLCDEVFTTKLASAKTQTGQSIGICRLLGQPVTLELPANANSSSRAKTPHEQFQASLTVFGLRLAALAIVLGGIIWLIRLLFKRGRIGCAVTLIVLLALFLLLLIPGIVWYLSAGSPGRTAEKVQLPVLDTTPLKRSPAAMEKQLHEEVQQLRQKKEALVRSGIGNQHPEMKSIDVQIPQVEKRIELEHLRQGMEQRKLSAGDPRFMTTAGTRELNGRYTLVVGAKPLLGKDGSSHMRDYTLKSSVDDGTNGVATFAPLAIQNEPFMIYWDRDTDELWLASPTIVRWHHLPESGKPSEQIFMQPGIPGFFKHRLPEAFREVVDHWYPIETTEDGNKLTLIATLTRRHYFEDDVPAAAVMACFKVDAENLQRNAFLLQNKPLYKNLSTVLRWGESRRFKVTLNWRQNGAQSWLELTEAQLLDDPEAKR
ncbi:MAG: hypothetical protein B7Z47_01080 [Chthoniobacter sp. 12-60-6]|nr:MAG: hypothetical protein B7Z47_01080 [Chthoniobacter sp. 12-60-6]